MTPAEIRSARAAAHRARARDFAEAHGIPEAALVAAFSGPGVVAIEAAPDRLMPLVVGLGEALALTRNASAVQERQGRYESFAPGAALACVTGPEIELRLAPGHWVHAFAVTEETAKAAKRSIQVFDAAGEAVHKIHLTPESDPAAFDRLVAALRLPLQTDALTLVPPPSPALPNRVPGTGVPPQIVDRPGAGDAPGQGLRDRAAAPDNTAPRGLALAPQAVTDLLERASAAQVPLEIRVGNSGCLQIFRGPVERILPAGYWINVMDPRFNLHLRTDHLAEVRLLEPSDRGGAPVVAAFDAAGGTIAEFTGEAGCATWEGLARDLSSATA